MNSIINLSPQQLRQAAAIQERIQSLQRQLGRMLGATTNNSAAASPNRGMSAAARAKIARSQRARWAKMRGGASRSRRSQGKMSAATKAKLAAKMRAIWAARRAGQR